MASGLNAYIEKLSKENYDTWKLQMGAILIKNDQWCFVDGSKPIPEGGDAKVSAWKMNDGKARADIILAITPTKICHMKNCGTSKEEWTKLSEGYQSKGLARKATLLKSLLFTKMKEGDCMSNDLNFFFNIVDKLAEMEIKVADDLSSILLLYSVPNSYGNFWCAMEVRDDLPKPEASKIYL